MSVGGLCRACPGPLSPQRAVGTGQAGSALAATFHDFETELLDDLGVVVDVAAEGPFRRHGDDLHPAPLHPLNGPDLFQKIEGAGHVAFVCPHDLAEVGGVFVHS